MLRNFLSMSHEVATAAGGIDALRIVPVFQPDVILTRLAAVSVLTELDAFYLDHRRCGDLDAGVDGPVVSSRRSILCPMAGPPHSGSDVRREVRRLAGLSRYLVSRAKAHIETAEQRQDRARNVLQVSVLCRALHNGGVGGSDLARSPRWQFRLMIRHWGMALMLALRGGRLVLDSDSTALLVHVHKLQAHP